MTIEIQDIPATEAAKPTLSVMPPPPQANVKWGPTKATFDFLLIILTPVFWLLRQLLTFAVWIDIRFFHDIKVSSKAKCPACGIRKMHEIKYAEDFGSLLHVCARCSATWGQSTVVPTTRWQVGRPEVSNSREEAVDEN